MGNKSDEKIEIIITPPSKLNFGFKELWQYRELLYFFTWRDIKVKYKQAVLGFLWAILQPFFTMVIFTLFFGKLLNVPSDNIPYPIFAYSGLLLWNLFAQGLTSAANSMVSNAHIIKKIYFPRLVIPISAIFVALFDFLMSFIVFASLMFYYQVKINLLKFILFCFASLLFVIVTTFGLGCLLSALNVKYRDFRYIIPFLVQSLMFLTPVIYPVSIIKWGWVKYLIAINPLSSAIDLMRASILTKQLDYNMLIISIISCLVIFFVGLIYFRKTEYYFADIA